jgi:adenylate kinase
MLIALTGTPGTGKTSVAKVLEKNYRVIYLKTYKDAILYHDDDRDTDVIDIEYLKRKIEKIKSDEDIIVEAHYAHEMPVDMVIVLRCHPKELEKRLRKRGYREDKIRENLEAEAMGLITSEALSYYGKDKVFEVDTTDKQPWEVAKEVEHVILTKDKEYKPRINYMEEILKWY